VPAVSGNRWAALDGDEGAPRRARPRSHADAISRESRAQRRKYIQEYTGFFTPGIVVIFVLGLFWKCATEPAAIAAAIGSFVLSLAIKYAAPKLPFMNRMLVVFLAALALAEAVSLLRPATSGRT